MMAKNKEKQMLILLLISMIIWGMSWSSAKVLSGYGTALSIAYIRFWIVVFALLPLLKLAKIKVTIKAKGFFTVGLGGFVMGSYSLLFFTGLQHGLAGAGGVLVTTLNPILAFLMGLLLYKKRPNKMELIGLALGLIAGFILLQGWQNATQILSSGNGYFVAAALLWAIVSKISSRAGNYGHPLSFNFWLHIATCLLLSFLVDFGEVIHILSTADRLFWGNILYFGIINSTFATATYLYSTTFLGAEKASTFIFLVPAGALAGSYFFLGETVHWYSVVGGVLGILAVFIINGKMSKK